MAILLLLLVTAVGATLLFPGAAAAQADGRREQRIFAFPEEP
jgi:hypothetical protein